MYNIEQIKNNATHYIRIMKDYTKDITVIVSNMFTYIDVKSRLCHVYLKRSNAENAVKYRANKKYGNTLHTDYERIYQGYHDHNFKHRHEYRRQEQAIHPHELGGISWFCKEDKLIIIIIIIVIKIIK